MSDEFAAFGGRQSKSQEGTISFDFASSQSTASGGSPPPWRVNGADTYKVDQLAGTGSINSTDTRWDVYGADLGHMFLHNGQLFVTFGDTFGGPDVYPFFSQPHADYRHNTMAWLYATPASPASGLKFAGMITGPSGAAKELIPGNPGEAGLIPTYGVSVRSRMFLYYMSVQQWTSPGHWTLNYSGIAFSDDGGQTWTRSAAAWPGNSNFGQVSLVHHGTFVYVFGIPGGRYGALQLARVPDTQILDVSAYQYWSGISWTGGNPASAVDIAPAPVGELSVQWNSFYKKWLMTYLVDPTGQIVVRMSDSLTGPWSAPLVVVTSAQFPQLYAPYITPLWNDGPDIWFNMSVYDHYQVYFMHTSLLPTTAGAQPQVTGPGKPGTTTSRSTSPFEHGAGDTPAP